MVERVVAVVFPIFVIVFIGWLFGRRLKPDMAVANGLNMDLFTPALVFSALAGKHYSLAEYGPFALVAVGVVLGSGALGWALARALGMQAKTLAPPMMFKNSGNMGLPLLVLAFGEQALPGAIMLMLITNLLHFSLGAWLLDHKARFATLWKVPVMAAGIAGVAVSVAGITLWPPLLMAIRMVGDVCVPLMLFSLGVRLTDATLHTARAGLLGALATPLAGLLVGVALLQLLGISGLQRDMLLVFAALPPAVLNYMFAERYRQEPERVASIVLVGNLLSVLVMPALLAVVLR